MDIKKYISKYFTKEYLMKTSVVIVVCLVLFYLYSVVDPHYIKVEKQKIENYQQDIDSLNVDLTKSKKNVVKLTIKRDSIDNETDSIKKKIINLNGQYYEKMDSVDNYNLHDINFFFSKRYERY